MNSGAIANVGVDLGAESGRVMLGVLADGRVTLHEVHRFAHAPVMRGGGLHWNVERLRDEMVAGLVRAIARANEIGVPAISVGVDSWGVDYGLVSRRGELIEPPRCYRDPRNAAAFEQVVAQIGRDRLYARTGNQLLDFNTLFQLAAQADADPGLHDAAERLMFMPDLMHWMLTGEVSCERTIASTSQCVDCQTRDWARDLLGDLRIPIRLFADMTPPASRSLPMLAGVAADIGARGMFVTPPASHDTASAVAAVPAAPDSRWAYISSGTWSLVGVERDGPIVSAAARDAPFTNEAGLGGTTRFLKVIPGLWLVQECRRAFEASGRLYDYAELTRLASDAPPSRAVIDPSDARLSAAGEMPDKIRGVLAANGQPLPNTVGEIIRCCLESLARSYAGTLEQLERVTGQPIDVLHVVGGGAQNALLNQLTADATGRRVVAGPVEATALGNVLAQSLVTGLISDRHALRRIVADSVATQEFAPCRDR